MNPNKALVVWKKGDFTGDCRLHASIWEKSSMEVSSG